MVVKKKPGKPTGIDALKGSSRDGRISLRLHPDIKSGLAFLAREDGRTLSGYVERLFVDHLRAELQNHIEADGSMVGFPEIRFSSIRRR